MIANITQGRIRSALGEHLIAVVIVGILVVVTLAGYPTLRAQTEGTAARAQQRVNMPLVVASYLDEGSYPPSTQAELASSSRP